MKTPQVPKPRLRQLQYGFVLSAIAFAFFPLSLYAEDVESGEQSPVAVLTQTVQSGAAKTVRRYPARIRAVEQVDVVSRLSADIEEIGFAEGGTVRKGQLLYRLDDTRFAAAVSNQTAQVAETRAKLELATLTFGRKRKLAEKEMAPRADFDSARAAKLELEANLDAAKAALALAEDDLRHARIVSPIDGRIGLTAKTAATTSRRKPASLRQSCVPIRCASASRSRWRTMHGFSAATRRGSRKKPRFTSRRRRALLRFSKARWSSSIRRPWSARTQFSSICDSRIRTDDSSPTARLRSYCPLLHKAQCPGFRRRQSSSFFGAA